MAEPAPRLWPCLALAATLACAAEQAEPPPYGFGSEPEQCFRLEAEEPTEVDGAAVEIQRLAEFRLAVDAASDSRYELAMLLGRYYLSVEGAPGGSSELVISNAGLLARGGPEGEMRVGPEEIGPGGASLRSLLARPIGGFIVDSSGVVAGTPWTSHDPLLGGVSLIDWLILALPVLGSDPEVASWSGERALPKIGRYDFGVSIPLQYERIDSDGPPGSSRIRAIGMLERRDIEVAVGLEGDVRFDYRGETDLDARGQVSESRAELRVRFDATDGTEVSSRHQLRISATECPEPSINPVTGRADSFEG